MRIIITIGVLLLGITVGLLARNYQASAQEPITCNERTTAVQELHPGVPFASSCTKDGTWALEWQSTTQAAPTQAQIDAQALSARGALAAAATLQTSYPAYQDFVDAMLECTAGAACDKASAMRDAINAKKIAAGKTPIAGNNQAGKKIVTTPVP